MKQTRFWKILTLAGLGPALWGLIPECPGEIIFGESARTQFEQWLLHLDDHFIDFEDASIPAGPISPIVYDDVSVSFETTQDRYPKPIQEVSWPVIVIPYGALTTTVSGSRALMGSGTSTGAPDGQSLYEIIFSEPQARVGLMRNWNTNSITRFWSADEVLLGEHQNTTNKEFVAWVADGPDPSGWVSVIEIDGLEISGTFQVGEVDDLFFGTDRPPDILGLVVGEEAENLFTQYRDVFGDYVLDFESQNTGALSSLEIPEIDEVITFRTTERRYPPPTIPADYPASVYVPGTGRTHELIGASSELGYADGQNPYRIEFQHLQQRVGLWRRWNTASVTRFYAEDGSLLAEHQNTTNHEFVGWVGNMGIEGTWVKWIEMDGVYYNGAYQAGCADDIHFSRIIPDEPRIKITRMEVAPGNQIIMEWVPLLMKHRILFSEDMVNWVELDDQPEYGSWTGTLDNFDGPRFICVAAENPFQ